MPRPKKDDAPMTPRGKLEAKLAKAVSPEAVEAIRGYDEAEAKGELGRLATYENDTISSRDSDQDLADAKEAVKELGASYKEALAAIKLRRALIGYRLEEMGKQ
jgi:hypothetical protein